MLVRIKCSDGKQRLGDSLCARWGWDGLARSSAGSGRLLPEPTMGRVVSEAFPREAFPRRFGLRSRTAALTSALIFVGFWLIGVLSRSPNFRSYSNHLTSLIPCSDMGVWGRYPGFIPTPPLLCKQ